MPRATISTTRAIVTTTTVDCPSLFRLEIEVREEDGKTYWEIRGNAKSRGASKLSKVEYHLQEILERRESADEDSRGSSRDWWYWGTNWGDDLAALIPFAESVCGR
jgi:hypothetical protein